VDGSKGARTSFSHCSDGLDFSSVFLLEMRLTADIHDEVRCCSQTHDFAPECDRQDFSAVKPGCTVEHAVYEVKHY
jgi:hypothetical protein